MLPEPVRYRIASGKLDVKTLREIRLRIGRGLMIETADGECWLGKEGGFVRKERDAYRVTKEDVKVALELLTGYSVYAFEEELRQGYFTVFFCFAKGFSP